MAQIDGKQIKAGTIPKAALSSTADSGLSVSDKNFTPVLGSSTGTGLSISGTPLTPGYVDVYINGVQAELGSGTDTLACCFATNIKLPFYPSMVGYSNVVAMNLNSTAWTWGNNSGGQLGDNSATSRSSPVSVIGGHLFSFLEAGSDVMFGLKADGTVWTWGVCTNGALGDNQTSANRSSPVSVVGGHSFTDISSGKFFNGALKFDGSAWTWGANTVSSSGSGQIGDNTTTDRSSPVSVVGGHSFSFLSCGGTSAVALKSDGTAWAWGGNFTGQIGDNSTTARSSPVSVVGEHSFTTVAVGTDTSAGPLRGHVVFLRSDGTAWSCGVNASGEIGDNTSSGTNRSSPTSVVGGHSFIAVSAGSSFSMGLKADGTCWTWGINSSGELADNTATNRSSPVSVIGNHSFIAISGGDGNTGGAACGTKSDGTTWTWGLATQGQIGDNQTAANRSSPVSVLSSGMTVRSYGSIVAGDSLVWNSIAAGFSLATTDTIDLDYVS